MLCPVCKCHLIVLELDQVEMDYCASCNGIWLDPGELELLLHMGNARPGPLSHALRTGGHKVWGQKRRCPVCRSKMLQVEVKGPPRVTVDRCRYGHGLWLDDRELGQLIEAAGGTHDAGALGRFCGRLFKGRRAPAQGDKDHVGTDSGQ